MHYSIDKRRPKRPERRSSRASRERSSRARLGGGESRRSERIQAIKSTASRHAVKRPSVRAMKDGTPWSRFLRRRKLSIVPNNPSRRPIQTSSFPCFIIAEHVRRVPSFVEIKPRGCETNQRGFATEREWCDNSWTRPLMARFQGAHENDEQTKAIAVRGVGDRAA
jgi:hypothetical protein